MLCRERGPRKASHSKRHGGYGGCWGKGTRCRHPVTDCFSGCRFGLSDKSSSKGSCGGHSRTMHCANCTEHASWFLHAAKCRVAAKFSDDSAVSCSSDFCGKDGDVAAITATGGVPTTAVPAATVAASGSIRRASGSDG